MWPFARRRSTKSWTNALCSSSVVLMKKSGSAPTRPGSGRQFSSTISSTNSFAGSPRSSATRYTFDACSSVPVRKNVSSARCLWWRVRMSAAIVVYACPMCGVEFT